MKPIITILFLISLLFPQDRDLLGDLNHDDNIDILDIVRTVNIILEIGEPPTEYELWASDINIDNVTNIQDIILIISIILGDYNWELIGFENEPIGSILIDSANDYKIFVGSLISGSVFDPIPGNLYKSENGGANWDTLLTGPSFRNLIQHPSNQDIIYASVGNYGVLKTINGGSDWFYINNGIFVNWETEVGPIAINPLNPNNLFAGTGGAQGGKLYISSNGGDFWQEITGQIIDNNVKEITFNPINPNEIYVGTKGLNKIFKSVDSGENWDEIYFDLYCGGIRSIIVDYENPQIIYAGLYDSPGVIKSIDGGENWIESNEGIVGNWYKELFMHPENQNIIYVGVAGILSGGIFKSTNGGGNWYSINENLNTFGVFTINIMIPESYIFLGTSIGLYKMIDFN